MHYYLIVEYASGGYSASISEDRENIDRYAKMLDPYSSPRFVDRGAFED